MKKKNQEDIIDPLYQFLRKKKPENLLIPCTAHKNPLYKHKNNAWNWNKVIENGDDFGSEKYQAILMKDMIVIDIDDKKLIQKYEDIFPILTVCPKVETTKGAHYYFNRTSECDGAAMYDHSRCFGQDGDEIDFKSICSTGTAGVVVVPPTKGKIWIRPLYNTPLTNFDGEIFNYFYDNWSSRRYVYTIKADSLTKEKKHTVIDDIEEDSTFNKVNLTDNDFNEIKNLVECLSENRSRDFPTWIKLCWCLKNIYAQYDDPHNSIRDLWLNFSSKCKNKYDKDESLDKWCRVIPRKSGLKIGTLKMWAEEDNFQKYNEIIVPNNIDEVVKKQIIGTIKILFHHQPTRIDSIVIKEYEEKKMIFANINETFCNICEVEHDEPSTFIIINNKYMYEKCRISSEKSTLHDIPKDLSLSISDMLEIKTTPEKAIVDFVNKYEKEDGLIRNINVNEVSKKTKNIMGYMFHISDKDFVCPLHNVVHDKPCNYLYVNVQKALLAIACDKSPAGEFFPQDGIPIPHQTMNIISGNTININNNITNNNYIGDSEEIYSDLFNETFTIFDDPELNKLMNISLKGYASDIANLFYYLAGDNFGVEKGKKDIWWAWDQLEQRWIETDAMVHLFCSEVLANKFDKVIEWFRNHTENDDLRKKRIFKIESIIKRLKDKDQGSIMAQAAIVYKNKVRYFEDSLDENKEILNFQGEVYDFEKLEFRKVTPADRVTKSVGYTIPQIDIDKRCKIMDFLESIMENKNQLNYLLIWLASCLDGKSRDEEFHILKGTGRNGKGVLRDIMAETLGSGTRGYFGTIASSMLTKERPSSDKPVADLLHIKGKRFITANEPEKSAAINSDFLKFLTGNDPIHGRWLYSNAEIIFQPQHSLALLCNDVPKMDANDEALWDRSRIIEFPYKFVTNPRNNKQKKVDKNLKTEIKGWGPQFMLILLEYYGKYINEGLNPTQMVLEATEEVRNENDLYKEFIQQKIEITNNNYDKLNQVDINNVCSEWMNLKHARKDFQKSSLRKAIEKIAGDLQSGLWINNTSSRGWSYIKWKNSL